MEINTGKATQNDEIVHCFHVIYSQSRIMERNNVKKKRKEGEEE